MSRAFSLLQPVTQTATNRVKTTNGAIDTRLRSERANASGFIRFIPALVEFSSESGNRILLIPGPAELSRAIYRSASMRAVSKPTFSIPALRMTLMARATSANSTGRRLLPRFELSGDQPDFVDARAAHDVNRTGHIGKQHIVVALDEGHLLRAFFEDGFQPRTQCVPGVVFLVDLELAAGAHLHDDGLLQDFLAGLLLVRGGLRH